MCTIIVRHQIDSFCSTVIASNRDEFYDRPATGPMVLHSDPLIVGGRDEREGGTWFGLAGSGLFLGLTNQRNFGARDDSLLSRGALVLDALRQGSLDRLRSFLSGLEPAEYNEFNLVFGDGDELGVAYGRRSAGQVEISMLGPGVHVLCNDRLGSAEFPKADRVRERVAAIPAESWSRLQPQLAAVLSDRSLPEASAVPPLPAGAPFDSELARHLQAVCVETPVYGTVSASIAAVSPGRVEQYRFSAGPPEPGSFEDMLALTRDAR